MMATDTHRTVDAIFRIEQAKLIAGLARIVRDVSLAEELAQDALVAALEQWPTSGVPDKPGAWLMAAAKHRAIDRLRRRNARLGMPRCPSLRKIFLFPPSSVPEAVLVILHERCRSGLGNRARNG